MSLPYILNAEPEHFNPEAASVLRQVGDYREIDCDRATLIKEVAKAEILIVRLRNRIDAEVLQAGKKLRFICTATTGLTHIDLAEAANRGIRVVSLQGETQFLESVTSTAELTWGLVLNLVRRIPAAWRHVREGNWDRDEFVGMELRDKTLGILGYGRLGKIVAGYGRAFRMPILACDLKSIPTTEGVDQVDLYTLLHECHVVSVHMSYKPGTPPIIGKREFERMRPGAMLINTARGELIDEDALADAIESGRLGGVGLDVLNEEGGPHGEWLASRRLVKLARERDNVIITPHIGGASSDAMRRTELFLARKVAGAFAREAR